MQTKLKGFFALLAAATIFSIFSVFIRTLSQYMSSTQQIALRGLTGFIVALALVLVLRRSWRGIKHADKRFLSLYIICFPLTIYFFVHTLTLTSVTIGTAAFYAGTLISSLALGRIVFKEKITPQKLTAMLLTLLGVAALIWPLNLATFNLGIIYGVTSGVIDALTNTFRKYFSDKVDRYALTTLQMVGIFALGAGLGLVNGQTIIPANLPASVWVLAFIYGGLLASISLLLLYGFSKFDLNLGTIVLSSELFLAPLFVWMIFSEPPTSRELLSALFVFLAVVVVNASLPQLRKHLRKSN